MALFVRAKSFKRFVSSISRRVCAEKTANQFRGFSQKSAPAVTAEPS
jgi:hypothetical protein